MYHLTLFSVLLVAVAPSYPAPPLLLCLSAVAMHTSGITVDDEVLSEFSTARQDPATLFLQYRIQSDRFHRTSTGQRTASRDADFVAMQRALSPSEPCFLVARPTAAVSGAAKSEKWLLVFYMPDGASVRDRMIYSSSSTALRDGLGSSAFLANTWNIRSPTECTAAHYQLDTNSVTSDEQLMTADELAAKDAETSSHLAMSSTRVAAIVGLPIQLEGDAQQRLSQLAQQKGHTAILKLDGDTERLSIDEQGSWPIDDIAARLPANEPRYVLTNFVPTNSAAGSGGDSVFVFVYYCPDNIKPKLKMFYSTCKQVCIKLCEQLQLVVAKSLEISERSELTTAAVMEALYPQEAVKKTFKKPGRPGRGNARLIGKEATE